MIPYAHLKKDALQNELEVVKHEIDEIRKLNLKLDMSRGKPCVEQLNQIGRAHV